MTAGWRRLTHRSARVTAAATASTVLIHLPVFLLGAMAVFIRDDVPAFDEVLLGAGVSVYFAVSAAASVVGGRAAELHGPRRGLLWAALLSAVALLVIGAAPSETWLLAAGALGGVANGLGQPSSNLGLARGVRGDRQGLAFGIKQSSVPMASLLTGIAVPLIALTLGWRVTCGVAALLAIGVVAIMPRDFGPAPGPARVGVSTEAPRRALLLLAGGAGLGAAAAASMATFAVLSAVASGIGAGTAGYLFAAGSGAGVISRLVIGRQADIRGERHLPVVTRLLVVGALGYMLLAAGGLHSAVVLAGMVLAFALGWGWPGLLAFAVVRLHPGAPGAASGVVLAGGTAGAVVGPLLFGYLARDASFAWAWGIAAMFSLVGAAFVEGARRTIRTAIVDGRMQRPVGRSAMNDTE